MGRKSSKTKLTGQEKKMQELLDKKVSYSAIGRILGVHRLTVSSYVMKVKNSITAVTLIAKAQLAIVFNLVWQIR